MSSDHKVGAVCMTVNTRHPAVNDGVLVVVVGVNAKIRSAAGEPCPYLVRSVDGSPFVSTTNLHTGERSWCKSVQVWAAGYKLKPIDMSAPDARQFVHDRLEVPSQ
jgi:hypothetical protein